jgi:hypothetical protein
MGIVKAGADVAEGRPVLLSPRVLDQRAFDDLSARLGVLLERAGVERDALEAAGERAMAAAACLREAEASHQQTLHLASMALERINEQVARAAEIMERIEARSPAISSATAAPAAESGGLKPLVVSIARNAAGPERVVIDRGTRD